MKTMLRVATVAAALLAGVSFAAAQSSLHLNSQQMTDINHAVSSATAQKAPSTFTAKIGEKVPSSLNLKQLPQQATSKVPEVKGMDYAKLDNGDILIVRPSTKDVADVWKAT